MTEEQKYSAIKKIVETDGNKKRAAITLSCSVRHINRMIKGYKEEGKLSLSTATKDACPPIPLLLKPGL